VLVISQGQRHAEFWFVLSGNHRNPSFVIPERREAPSPESISISPVPAMACHVYLPASKKHGPLYHDGVLSERIGLFVH
jgi:hypothetical protein